MILVFDLDNNLVIAQKKLNRFYVDNDDYISAEVDDYDIEYSYTLVDNEVVKGDKIVFTDEELKDIEKLNKRHKYQQPRMKSYPSVSEQLDKLYHDIENGTLNKDGNFYKSIKEIKDTYPKK